MATGHEDKRACVEWRTGRTRYSTTNDGDEKRKTRENGDDKLFVSFWYFLSRLRVASSHREQTNHSELGAGVCWQARKVKVVKVDEKGRKMSKIKIVRERATERATATPIYPTSRAAHPLLPSCPRFAPSLISCLFKVKIGHYREILIFRASGWLLPSFPHSLCSPLVPSSLSKEKPAIL